MSSFELFDQKLDYSKLDVLDKLSVFNKNFQSSVKPENGVIGITEVVKDTGILERTWRNPEGQLTREYSRDGFVYMLRKKVSDNVWEKTCFDQNGTAYLKEIMQKGKNNVLQSRLELVPNAEVVKKNFTAKIDEFGRPVLNKIKDLSIKEESRKPLSDKLKDSSYKETDHRGHLIADMFDGPASKENIVAQDARVNQGQMSKVENIIKQLKQDGHTVDYEVKTNYVGTDKRPSSFEPKITVDGKPYELPKDLRKIFNHESSTLSNALTTVGEKVGLHHEMGMKAGVEAAALTMAVSTVDNVTKFVSGEISAEEMVTDIAKDTGVAGAIGYGTGFISSAVSQAVKDSSHTLLKNASKAGVPAAIIAFGIDSYDSITDFAKGEIDGSELAYDLGESAASVAGGMAGTMAATAAGAKVGAIVGSVVPGAGTAAGAAVGAVAGFGVGVVGGMVGTAVASEAYKTAVEVGSKAVDELADKAQEVASNTIEAAKAEMPDKVNSIRDAINSFASDNSIPIHV